ncbi:hypothetical protein M9H77_03529 [Catharanthus roseus]|uniref:Uncharacterized protein n=1 Tax=Catharanthus roseus TaxID=4058 RepID=A0ACC0CBZ3_CATRO|nr:hypothetical protein M9H77_03529 [Catharanthus roseus]
MMSFSFFNSIIERVSPRWPFLIYATTWTILLTIVVAIASFSPEIAFVSAINPNSSFSKPCYGGSSGLVRLPLDNSREIFCFPVHYFKRSKMDVIVPPIFAAIIVATSAYAVKALALWEVDDDDHHHDQQN